MEMIERYQFPQVTRGKYPLFLCDTPLEIIRTWMHGALKSDDDRFQLVSEYLHLKCPSSSEDYLEYMMENIGYELDAVANKIEKQGIAASDPLTFTSSEVKENIRRILDERYDLESLKGATFLYNPHLFSLLTTKQMMQAPKVDRVIDSDRLIYDTEAAEVIRASMDRIAQLLQEVLEEKDIHVIRMATDFNLDLNSHPRTVWRPIANDPGVCVKVKSHGYSSRPVFSHPNLIPEAIVPFINAYMNNPDEDFPYHLCVSEDDEDYADFAHYYDELDKVANGSVTFAPNFTGQPTLGEAIEAGSINIPQAMKIIVDAMNGVQFLHQQGWAHEELLSCHIMVCEESGVLVGKLFDFEGAIRLGAPISSWTKKRLPGFESGINTPANDVFLFALMILRILGILPHYSKIEETMTSMADIARQLVARSIPVDVIDLLCSMLSTEAKERPSLQQCMAVLKGNLSLFI